MALRGRVASCFLSEEAQASLAGSAVLCAEGFLCGAFSHAVGPLLLHRYFSDVDLPKAFGGFDSACGWDTLAIWTSFFYRSFCAFHRMSGVSSPAATDPCTFFREDLFVQDWGPTCSLEHRHSEHTPALVELFIEG